MKKKNIFYTVTTAVALAITFLAGCKKETEAPYADKGYSSFAGNATFSQMTPLPAAASTGTAVLTARFDNNSKVFNYFLKWQGLAGLMTGANFYFPSDAVQNGVLARNIVTPTSPRPVLDSLYGQIWGNNTLSDKELADLKAGNVYFIINTQTNTAGEIRGQVTMK